MAAVRRYSIWHFDSPTLPEAELEDIEALVLGIQACLWKQFAPEFLHRGASRVPGVADPTVSAGVREMRWGELLAIAAGCWECIGSPHFLVLMPPCCVHYFWICFYGRLEFLVALAGSHDVAGNMLIMMQSGAASDILQHTSRDFERMCSKLLERLVGTADDHQKATCIVAEGMLARAFEMTCWTYL